MALPAKRFVMLHSESEDLRQASAEDNFIVELNHDGTVRYAPHLWKNSAGERVLPEAGAPFAQYISKDSNGDIFRESIEAMEYTDEPTTIEFHIEGQHGAQIRLEAQGMLIRLPSTDPYSMWVLRRAREPVANIKLSPRLTSIIGCGAGVLELFLSRIAESVHNNAISVPAPPRELCRICEKFIQTWWFERHCDLCGIEHRIESRIIACHENIVEHRSLILSIIARTEERYQDLLLPASLRPKRAQPDKFAVHVSSPLAKSQDQVQVLLETLLERVAVALDIDIPEEDEDQSDESMRSYLNSTRTRHNSTEYEPCKRANLSIEDPPLVADREISPTAPVNLTETANNIVETVVNETVDPVADETVETVADETVADEGPCSPIERIHDWEPLSSNNEALQALVHQTDKLISDKVALVMRMSHFMEFKRRIRQEMEDLVHNAIESTVATASAADTPNPNDRSHADSVAVADTDLEDDESNSNLAAALEKTSDIYREVSRAAMDSDISEQLSEFEFPLRRPSHVNLRPTRYSLSRSLSSSGVSPGSSPRLSPAPSPALSPFQCVSPLPSRRSFSLLSAHPKRTVSQSTVSSQASSPVTAPLTPSSSHLKRDRRPSSMGVPVGSPDDDRRLSLSLSSSSQKQSSLPSIKDYEIIRAISKGAFGVVYLTRKKLTGSLFAVKVLKKQDMVEKNQVSNVRAERAIMISTADSEYVAKLYYTFQSADFLYLVMEYVNGGDCATLLRSMACFPEDWAKRYVAEVAVAINSLHLLGIVHRDLKPDNLLIDSRGHLKLADFGLSIMGAIKKHRRYGVIATPKKSDAPAQAASLSCTRFCGTPDYLAPEILNNEPSSTTSDWWSLGCIFYEFLYGFPPFNDTTPQKIFDNILSHNYAYPVLDDNLDVSQDAKSLIDGLLTLDPEKRLGANGVSDIQGHPFFKNIDWDTLFEQEAPYIPGSEYPKSTNNFNTRGAELQSFPVDTASAPNPLLRSNSLSRLSSANSLTPTRTPSSTPLTIECTAEPASRRNSVLRVAESPTDEFGAFTFRNLPVLEQANQKVLSKLRTEPRSRNHSVSGVVSDGTASSDTDERVAAMRRVTQRRKQMRRPLTCLAPDDVSNYKLCILIWRPVMTTSFNIEDMLDKLGCLSVICESIEDLLRRASSSVKFDLVLLEQRAGFEMDVQTIRQMLTGTCSANSASPVVVVGETSKVSSQYADELLQEPVSMPKLIETLQRLCHWKPPLSQEQS